MIDENKFKLILDSKEKRARRQKEIIDKYKKTLISFTLNIPGIVKDKPAYREIHKEGVRIINRCLKDQEVKIVYIEELEKATGREAYIVVEKDEYKLKEMTVNIENHHPLGRIFDIDIFNRDNEGISRNHIGENTRKCLLCSLDARICMREKNHTYENLIEAVHDIWEEYNN